MIADHLFLRTQGEGRAALTIAAQKGDTECVRLLLAAGADKEDPDYVRVEGIILCFALSRRSIYDG